MTHSLVAGSTSQSIDVFLEDSSSTTGAGLTGLAYNTAGLTCYYRKSTSSPVAVTLATQTVTGAYSSGGFVEVDATTMPGVYRFDIPNAAISTLNTTTIYFKGATNLKQTPLRISTLSQPSDVQLIKSSAPTMTSGNLNANLVLAAGQTVAVSPSGTVTFVGSQSVAYTGSQVDLVNAPNSTAVTAIATAARDISNSSPAANSVGATINSVKAKTDNLPSDPASTGDIPSVSAIAAGVRDVSNVSPAANSVGEIINFINSKAGDTFDAVEAITTTINETHSDVEGIATTATSINSKIGSFTATGVNTILGFFKALMSKAASTPSDVGGTFSATTDSTEAIRDRGDAAWITGESSYSITIPPAVAIASQSPSVITAVRGDTLSRALPVMGTLTGRSSLVFTLKRTLSEPDSKALIQVSESGGLLTVDGVAASSSGLGSLTVTNASTGAVTLVVDETIMSQMPIGNNMYWDCQSNISGTISTPISGRFNITGDVTRATS